MGIAEILALIVQGTQAIKTAADAYNDIKDTLSETDQAKIDQALADAQAETDRLRPQVDAALDEAAKSE